MGRLGNWFALPARDAGPVERLRWARRMESVSGVAALIATATVWSNAWWNWVMVGVAFLALSPWPGPAAVLRKAQKRPEVLNRDLARGRRRGRRTMKVLLPSYAVIFTVIG
jgi:hypothetical protein